MRPLLSRRLVVAWMGLQAGAALAAAAEVVERPSLPTVATMAMAPILGPETLTFENRGGVLDLLALPGLAASKGIAHSRAVELSNLLRSRNVRLGEEMTQALVDALKEAGVDTLLLTDPARVADDPTALDYPRLSTDAPLVLSGTFDEVGFYSGRLTTRFVPRVNVTVNLVKRLNEQSVYSQSVYYGADARKPAEDQIPSDPRYSFDSYQDAIARPGDLVDALRDGIQRIAKLVAGQLARVPR